MRALLLRIVLRFLARDAVTAAYLGVLGRGPDQGGLLAYSETLGRTGSYSGVLDEISHSQENWERLLARRSEDVVRNIYRGLLGRDPDREGLDSYASDLAARKDIVAVIAGIAGSKEHWERLLAQKSEDVVVSAYRGLLGKDPDKDALDSFASRLAHSKDIAALVFAIVSSNEFGEIQLTQRAPEIVRSIYLALLKREPDPDGLSIYTQILRQSRTIVPILASVAESDEFKARIFPARQWPDPALLYDETTWVFLHIQKTAGTSVQNMLLEVFPPGKVFHTHDDPLHQHCPGELSTYMLFAGHFDFDSLAYIPKRNLRKFTFVRNPSQRLISLYRFWRSHEPTPLNRDDGIDLANTYCLHDFLLQYLQRPRPDPGVWNHMTWALMGQRKWVEWHDQLANVTGTPRHALLSQIRAAIQERVTDLEFVGLQENFGESCALLFSVLGRPLPSMHSDHATDNLARSSRLFKPVPFPPITPTIQATLAQLVELDAILYEAARVRFLIDVDRASRSHATQITDSH